MTAPALTQSQRAALQAFAEVIAPGSDRQPSARDLDLAAAPLDFVLQARPDLVEDIAALLERLDAGRPTETLIRLEAEEPRALGLLLQIVAGAYYADARVRAALAYPGQRRLPPEAE